MDAYVVYDTEFGNTEQVARAVGAALGDRYTVRVASVKEVTPPAVAGADLLILGAPTEAHGISPEMRHWLSGIERDSLTGVRATAFDTRFHMPRLLSGSAAVRMTARLRRAGCDLIGEPESFFVEQHKVGDEKQTRLLDGELERVNAWVETFARTHPGALNHQQRVARRPGQGTPHVAGTAALGATTIRPEACRPCMTPWSSRSDEGGRGWPPSGTHRE